MKAETAEEIAELFVSEVSNFLEQPEEIKQQCIKCLKDGYGCKIKIFINKKRKGRGVVLGVPLRENSAKPHYFSVDLKHMDSDSKKYEENVSCFDIDLPKRLRQKLRSNTPLTPHEN